MHKQDSFKSSSVEARDTADFAVLNAIEIQLGLSSIDSSDGNKIRKQQTAGVRKNSDISPTLRTIKDPLEMEFSSNDDSDSKEQKIFEIEKKSNDQSEEYDSVEYSKLGIAPADTRNTVLICFFILGFVAWFPCY